MPDVLPADLRRLLASPPPDPQPGPSHLPTLKRRASPAFEDRAGPALKRPREDDDVPPVDDASDDETQTDHQNENEMQLQIQTKAAHPPSIASMTLALADDLEQELLCGCCSALLHRPVVVYPCQHYFCGR